jgi:hypothetical protein
MFQPGYFEHAMADKPFDGNPETTGLPAKPGAREKATGVRKRVVIREAGGKSSEDRARRLAALADAALRESEAKAALAHEAGEAAIRAKVRYGRSGNPDDLAEAVRHSRFFEFYKRQAAKLRQRAAEFRRQAE